MQGFTAGESFTVECPFLRTAYEAAEFTDGRLVDKIELGWRPGANFESDGCGETWAYSHGIGQAVYKIIDIHKLPFPHKTRVFYIRTWIDPDGKPLGKKTVQILTPNALRERINKARDRSFDLEIVEFSDADAKRLVAADRARIVGRTA
jgi:hypothetical protein